MKLIGLIGGTGSGKSLVSRYLEKKGARIVDADAVAHEIIEKGKEAYIEIVAYFGREILDEKEEIVRKRLGNIVFADSQKLAFLNQCTHRHIYNAIVERIASLRQEGKGSMIILDAPLFNDAYANLCDEVWAVYAEESIRINRIMNRDGISLQQAKNRIQSQPDFKEYEKYASHVIHNDQEEAHIYQQVDALCLFLGIERNANV